MGVFVTLLLVVLGDELEADGLLLVPYESRA